MKVILETTSWEDQSQGRLSLLKCERGEEGVEKSGFYRQGLPSKPHKLCRKEWEEKADARGHSPVERWRSYSGGGRVRGGLECGCPTGHKASATTERLI